MNGNFYELAMWQQKWCMDNLPPLPIITWVSPHYDPYEINHSHYNEHTNNHSFITYEHGYEDRYEEENEYYLEPYSDSESDDDNFY